MAHQLDKMNVYQRAVRLASEIVLMTDNIRPFRLGEQMAASAVSIASNISEGSERPTKEFIRFLDYARGSASELHTQIQIALLSDRYDHDWLKVRAQEALEIKTMLFAFQAHLKMRIASNSNQETDSKLVHYSKSRKEE
jgi:four helix bundle protein